MANPTKSFLTNSIIIPMDTTYQNTGNAMFLAYGLVYQLLANNIPVNWAIQSPKAYNGTDFSAVTKDLTTGTALGSVSYNGGPFIIDSAYYTQALPIIQAWRALNPSVNVHVATATFTAPIAATLCRKPRISIDGLGSASVMFGYLNLAMIPDSLGNLWTTKSPDILKEAQIGGGAFFKTAGANDPCPQLNYDIFLSDNTAQDKWKGAANTLAQQLDLFLKLGGMMHATCKSIDVFEIPDTVNYPLFRFLTTTGIANTIKQSNGTFNFIVPDFPSEQAVSSVTPQGIPSSCDSQIWLHSSVTYRPSAKSIAQYTANSLLYDFMAAGSYKGGTGAGKIVYEGGEYKYETKNNYLGNNDGPFIRFVLDSVFFSVAKPYFIVATSPTTITSNPATTTVTYTLTNAGCSAGSNVSTSITLPSWAANIGNFSVAPSSQVVNLDGTTTLTWNAGTLSGNPGTNVTFTADLTPPVPATGMQSVASYTATYNDNFGESYTTNTCSSLNVAPGAAPQITKTTATPLVHPNDTITWTITAGNAGKLALNNVVITDTLPAGLTYVSAVPAPSSVSGGGVNPTVLVWQTPQIAASIPANSPNFITITLNAKAPPATSAIFTNSVTLAGTDTLPAQYSVTTTSVVTVADRPPTVAVSSPKNGDLVCSGTDIIWTASDPDGDPLTYTLLYSADGGTTYTQIITGLTGTCSPTACSYFWDTTSLPSGSNYVVKVVASDGLLTGEGISTGTFTIDNIPPTVSWTAPTNGSLLTTTPVTLSASASDNVGVFSVEFLYSQDGITFTSIHTSFSPPYTTPWNISGLPHGAYTLRVIATDTCGKTAQADINVTVNLPPTVAITSPQPGATLCPPTTTITWTASSPGGNSLTFDLSYSSDGGVNYAPLASGLTGNSFVWNTTGLPSGTNYFIKIVASDGLTTSQSVVGPLTVDNTPPTISWVSPTNGALLTTSPVTLQASATSIFGINSVQFQYSTDGITFTNIGAPVTVPSSGSIYSTSWNFSSLSGGLYHLRAVAVDKLCSNQTSNADITVNATLPPTLTITSPQAGNVVCPQGTTITWNASSPLGRPLTFTIQYSSTGGAPFTTIASGLPGPCPCSYSWNTTGLPSGSNYVIQIIASDGITTTTTLSGVFTIDNTPPTVAWLSPANDALITASPVTLQATATDNIGISNVQFQYSTDGITFTNIDGPVPPPPSGNTYSTSWNFNSLSGGLYHLRAAATDNPCGQTSHADITVTATLPPTVTITSPQAGDIICPQGTNITWNASSPLGRPLTFTIRYSATGGSPFTQIITGLPGPCPCSYFWNTTGLPSGSNYVIQIIASDGITTTTATSGTFTIDNTPPTVSWISPVNGALITTSPVNLQALATDNIGIASVKFQYSADGITYTDIVTLSPPAPGNIYSYSWNYSSLPSGVYHLRVIATDTPCNQTTQATITVTLTLPPTVTVVSPNGGEIICPQQGTDITWNASSPNGDPLHYSLLYSADGGTTFTIIATGLTGVCSPAPCSYHWDTSALPSGSNYLIKVVASNGIVSAEDVSNAPFTIDNTPPVVVITAPAPGSYLHGTVTITATATDNIGIIGGVTFEYSNDNGVTYNLIGTVPTPLAGVYAINWNTIPRPDGKYKIRASASDHCNTTSAVIDVNIDNTPPTVAIPSPPNNSTVSGEVPILVTAADNECLAKVELYIDGVLVHTETLGAVKTDEFLFNWNTNDFAEGPHIVKAVATDCAGLTAETTNTYIVDNLPDHFQQLLVDGTLTIPPQKPDVEQILDMTVTPVVNHINIFNTIDGTKVTVTGIVDIGITYSAVDPYHTQEEHFAEFTVPFHAMILYPGLPLDAKVQTVIFVEHKQWHLLDSRTIKKDIVLFVGIKQCTP